MFRARSVALILLVVWLLFFVLGTLWYDPDFGWHLKVGEYISRYGVPRIDLFTYTMPSYPYLDYEWLSNYLFYFVYGKLGFGGLSLVYSFFVVLIPVVLFYKKKEAKYWILPSVLFWSVAASLFGVRPQVSSWFFFGILSSLLLSEESWNRYKWLYPVVIFFWVNFHGSYPLGLIVLGIYLSVNFFEKKVLSGKDLLIFIASLLAILINPYGVRNILEITKQMSQTGFFRQTIQEWYPIYTSLNFSFYAISIFSAVMMWVSRKSFRLSHFFIFYFLIFSALSSVRLTIYSSIFSALVLAISFFYFDKSLQTKEQKRRFKVFHKLLLVLTSFIFLGTMFVESKNLSVFRENKYFPDKAISYLRKMDYQGNLFSTYNWGGYLIWKYPEKKVFVDGRMAGFFWDAPEGESGYAFKDYLEIDCGRLDIESQIKKFNIEVFLLEKPKVNIDNRSTSKLTRVIEFDYSYCKSDFELSKKVEDLGWIKSYQDDLAVVYTKLAE